MIRKSLWIAIGIIFVAAAIVGAIKFPLTNPWIIRAKVRLLGPGTVYWPLSYYDDSWDVVLAGVKSGSPVWLHVAAELYPALDTHPGEEMYEAVSTVIERNPVGAISILVPVYGADLVCGKGEEWQSISQAIAEKRLQTLTHIESAVSNKKALEACRKVLRSAVQPSDMVDK